MLKWPSRRQLVDSLLSIPATAVWLPICAHYLFVFGIVIGLMAVRGLPPIIGAQTLAISLGVSVLCIAGLLGLAALWSLIFWGEEISASGSSAHLLLRGGLWAGVGASLVALALGGYAFWESGFNLVLHSLFLTVLGPIAVFFREARSPSHPGGTAQNGQRRC